MVLEEGRKNGVGIWELSGYKGLHSQIESRVMEFIETQDFVSSDDLYFDRILVVGSFGSGMGVKGKSDIDIVVLVGYHGDHRSNDFSRAMKHMAGAINKDAASLASSYPVTGLEAYVYPYLEAEQHLYKMASHEPVTHYYDLTDDRKVKF